MLKEALAARGEPRNVHINKQYGVPWFSVTCGDISVHCLSAELRAELELERLAPNAEAITWWRQGEQRLTLRNIGSSEKNRRDSIQPDGEWSDSESESDVEAEIEVEERRDARNRADQAWHAR